MPLFGCTAIVVFAMLQQPIKATYSYGMLLHNKNNKLPPNALMKS
jgi:hypothetical protein